jgi:upstream activation factor subunit UAF30
MNIQWRKGPHVDRDCQQLCSVAMTLTPQSVGIEPMAASAGTKPKMPAKVKPAMTAAALASAKVNALQKPLQPSPELAAIVGNDPIARVQVVSKPWKYTRAHNLQNPADKREILADAKLQAVFGRDKCTMFEMNKYLAQHLK